MKSRLALFISFVLLLCLLAGCAGTPVIYYTECNCPEGSHSTAGGTSAAAGGSSAPAGGTSTPAGSTAPAVSEGEGALKTGLAIVANAKKSEDGVKVEYDVTLAAVLVDDNGVIQACIIDSIGTTVTIDGTGAITDDITKQILTKNELGYDYNMKAYAGSDYEWFEQADALADYAVGKTVDELKNGAVDESGYAPEGSDLASTATIYIGGYVGAIEAAVNNAQQLGAEAGDELRLASISSVGSSVSAAADKNGTAQLDCDVTALTVKDGVITSCVIDSLQAKVSFDIAGKITTDLSVPFRTKNQLGADYGMVAYGKAKAEWNEQAAGFAKYVTGKTADEVASIAVIEGKPSEADLSASVTISIGGFQALIAKAMA